MRAVRAGHRGVFDDGHRRFVIAHTISGKASGFINSPPALTYSAKASAGNGGNEETPITAVASAKAAVFWQNSRRVMCN